MSAPVEPPSDDRQAAEKVIAPLSLEKPLREAVQDFERESLKARCDTKFGVTTITFGPGEYRPSLEPALRELGVDIVRVENPAGSDRVLLVEGAGYYVKPTHISWRMKVRDPRDHAASMSSRARYRFNAELKKSEDVNAGFKPLNPKTFDNFLRVYEEGVVEKERGRAAIDRSWITDKRDDPSYRILVLSSPTGQTVGSAILHFNAKTLEVTIAYCAFLPAAKHFALGYRIVKEALRVARKEGYQELTHGQDSNLYGYYLAPGLFEFKSRAGFTPEKAGTTEIVKVLNPAAVGGECVFVKEAGGELSVQQLADHGRPLSVPREMSMASETFNVSSHSTVPFDPLRIAVAVASGGQSVVDDAIQVYNDTYGPQGSSHYQSWAYHKAKVQSVETAVRLTLGLLQGYGDFEHMAAYVDVHAKSTVREPTLLDEEFDGLCEREKLLKLASALCEAPADSYDMWRGTIALLGIACQLSPDVFDTVSNRMAPQMVGSFFTSVLNVGGSGLIKRVLVELDRVVPLRSAYERVDSCRPVDDTLPHGPVTFDQMSLEKYVRLENPRAVMAHVRMVKEIVVSLALLERGWSAFDPQDGAFHATIGGHATNNAAAILKSTGSLFMTVACGAGKQFGTGRFCDAVAKNLRTLTEVLPEPAKDAGRSFRIRSAHGLGDMPTVPKLGLLFAAAGIEPSAIPMWGRRLDDIFRDVWTYGSNEQVSAFFTAVTVRYKDHEEKTPELNAVHDAIPGRQKSEITLPPAGACARLITEYISGLERAVSYDPTGILRRILNTTVGPTPANWNFMWDFVEELGWTAYNKRDESLLEPASVLEALLKEKNTSQRTRAIFVWLYYHPNLDLSADTLGECIGTLDIAKVNRVTLYDVFGLVLGTINPKTRDRACLLASKINPAVVKVWYSRDFTRPTPIVSRLQKHVLPDGLKAQVEDDLLDLQRALATGASHDASTMANGPIFLMDDVFGALGLDCDRVWADCSSFGRRFPQVALLFLCEALRNPSIGAGFLDRAGTRPLVEQALADSGPFSNSPIVIRLAELPWTVDRFSAPSRGVSNYINFRREAGTLTTLEVDGYVRWTLEKSDRATYEFVEAVDLIPLCSAPVGAEMEMMVATKLQTAPFESCWAFRRLAERIDANDALGNRRAREKWYGTPAFLKGHPWETYGFSPEVCDLVRSFADQAGISERRVMLIATFLFSVNDQKLNRYWVSRLILSTPQGNSDNLVSFLRYWNSLSAESQNHFLQARFSKLLAETRLRVSREATGHGFDSLAAGIEERRGADEPIPTAMLERYAGLTAYRALFEAVSASRGEARDAALVKIDEELLADFPPNLDPEAEQANVIGHFKGLFNRALNPLVEGCNRIAPFLEQHGRLLDEIGILPRLVQYSSFADQDGKRRMTEMLTAYADPARARLITVTHPELGGAEVQHFELFRKFEALRAQLLTRNIPAEVADAFIEKWGQLWYFARVPEAPGHWHTVTHDWARWATHAERPQLSCQRWTSIVVEMPTSNWNYQYGPSPNANGRPISRVLSPKLAVSDIRVGRSERARCVVEVTVDDREGKPRIALLTERVMANPSLANAVELYRASHERFADYLGVDRKDVYCDGAESYPPPLPDEHPIYRDFYRP